MVQDIKSALRPALALTVGFALLLGLLYPLAMTGIGQVLFPAQANGSLIRNENGTVIGSALIGQNFTSDAYFRGRPSAAGDGYDAMASSGSNLGPGAKALTERVQGDIATLGTSPEGSIPPDLVTTSASGLDPHISPEAAFLQASRVAAARGIPAVQVRGLAEALVERPLLGFIGEPRVNVLLLNIALDRTAARP
ncbi:potassium-transporting ATPase subunit KdpC [Sphingomonas sp. AX6]|uniref:potassium-transporting ATPase subunit KdpC n=1 Tax=Sphingomonas sp. AX6 TaxID=2653171 RepID=UPI0012F20F6D|nr:potassium-transporting ATPase subunit KdpC [Sphingomonas sp. AX6]VXC68280.1 potassium translocating ATPase, subunit C [Sphingomonas sp. AX6]